MVITKANELDIIYASLVDRKKLLVDVIGRYEKADNSNKEPYLKELNEQLDLVIDLISRTKA